MTLLNEITPKTKKLRKAAIFLIFYFLFQLVYILAVSPAFGGYIYGLVTNRHGVPIDHVRVTATRIDGDGNLFMSEGYTSTNGLYTLTVVCRIAPDGACKLWFEAGWYWVAFFPPSPYLYESHEVQIRSDGRAEAVGVSVALAGPDLTVSSLIAPATGAQGGAINISDITANSEAGLASASKTGFYLSTNATLEATDTLLGARPVPALAGAATSTGTTSVTIPSGTPTGTYYIIAKTDYENAVPETSETNNTRTAVIKIGSSF